MKKEIMNQDGTSEIVEMTEQEIAELDEGLKKSQNNALSIIEHQNQVNKKIQAQRTVFEKLGLTTDEIDILLG